MFKFNIMQFETRSALNLGFKARHQTQEESYKEPYTRLDAASPRPKQHIKKPKQRWNSQYR